MAKLTLHDVYGRFRADMFLSSLIESSKSRSPRFRRLHLTIPRSYRTSHGDVRRQVVLAITFDTRYLDHSGQCRRFVLG